MGRGHGLLCIRFLSQSWNKHMGVSKNKGTPKSSILIGFSVINHPFWRPTPIFGLTPIWENLYLPASLCGMYQLVTDTGAASEGRGNVPEGFKPAVNQWSCLKTGGKMEGFITWWGILGKGQWKMESEGEGCEGSMDMVIDWVWCFNRSCTSIALQTMVLYNLI